MNIPCICPPKGDAVRHPDGDEITFRERLDFRSVAAIRWEISILQTIDPLVSMAEQFGAVTELSVLAGIETWTLVDEKGKAIEVTKPAIRERILGCPYAQQIGDEADRTYQEVMLPLLLPGSPSSPPTPTGESTSPRTDDSKSPTEPEDSSSSTSSRTPRKPSKPSSITTIPTADTAVTTSSLDGDSSSSQSSTSAA
jgi:hypothetical protein